MARRSGALRPAQPQDHYAIPATTKLGSRKGGTIGFLWEHPIPSAGHRAGPGRQVGAFGKELKERIRVFRDSKMLQFETYAEWLPTAGTAVSVEDSVMDSTACRWRQSPSTGTRRTSPSPATSSSGARISSGMVSRTRCGG